MLIPLKYSVTRSARIIVLICLMVCSFFAQAQKKDTAGKTTINIVKTTDFVGIKTDSGDLRKFIGDVEFEQNGTLMFCDSAYLNDTKNTMEAFGNVRIIQPAGTQVEGDYLQYAGNTKLAFVQGNAHLTDGKSNLWCEALTYDLNTKIGTYNQGGTLQSETTTVSSNEGSYNVNSKDARFTHEVYVTDPKYNVTSEDLGYNTNTKVVTFYDSSIVVNDKSVLRTKRGTWDSKNEVAHFIARSSLFNDAQYIEADSIDYNRKTGFGKAKGRVIAIDTNQKTTMYSGYAEYNEITKKLWSTMKPVMKKMNGSDSLFIRADTFFAAPVGSKRDTVATKVDKPQSNKEKKRAKKGTTIATDTTASVNARPADTTKQRYFIGYHHVLIFSDSLQGSCDSISYSQADTTMRMMVAPVAWSRNSQITGDTILLYTDSNRLKKLYVPNNALIVSLSGPPKANMYDQIQGKTLTGNFVNNELTDMLVWPNAEFIYYAKDESGAYLGVNQGSGEKLHAVFKDRKIEQISIIQEPKQTLTPIEQANISTTRLSRFQWLEYKRPKSLEELFK